MISDYDDTPLVVDRHSGNTEKVSLYRPYTR